MNRELENNLMQQYVNLVISQAMSFKPNTISDFEDLLQAGGIGLLQAIRTYDADKDTQFSTYATTLIRNEILNECENTRSRHTVHAFERS
jgi:RNA polymerase sigma factor for flagellar operon FliA